MEEQVKEEGNFEYKSVFELLLLRLNEISFNNSVINVSFYDETSNQIVPLENLEKMLDGVPSDNLIIFLIDIRDQVNKIISKGYKIVQNIIVEMPTSTGFDVRANVDMEKQIKEKEFERITYELNYYGSRIQSLLDYLKLKPIISKTYMYGTEEAEALANVPDRTKNYIEPSKLFPKDIALLAHYLNRNKLIVWKFETVAAKCLGNLTNRSENNIRMYMNEEKIEDLKNDSREHRTRDFKNLNHIIELLSGVIEDIKGDIVKLRRKS